MTDTADGIDVRRPGGTYLNGSLMSLRVAERSAYVLQPYGPTDSQRRWAWIAPSWLGLPDDFGVVQHRFYAEALLARGFHVAGIDLGYTFGSPRGAEVCQEFYATVRGVVGLSGRVRLLVQSNGGLIGYAWAFRHANVVDRIFGIYPVIDYFTWPPGDRRRSLLMRSLGWGMKLVPTSYGTGPLSSTPLKTLHLWLLGMCRFFMFMAIEMSLCHWNQIRLSCSDGTVLSVVGVRSRYYRA